MADIHYKARTVQPHLSDHLGQMMYIEEHHLEYSGRHQIKRRVINQSRIQTFVQDLENISWNKVGTANTDEQFSVFYRGLKECLDRSFPLTPYTVKAKQRIPWSTDELKAIKNLLARWVTHSIRGI
ncbi:hypothetical protein QE152_g30017 [Popillia japonica]|uniref:Uncharacterized protein n=1 Tax=Popillia japonica TaxID=7064 RepID=A0AAW1JFR3_POPJA